MTVDLPSHRRSRTRAMVAMDRPALPSRCHRQRRATRRRRLRGSGAVTRRTASNRLKHDRPRAAAPWSYLHNLEGTAKAVTGPRVSQRGQVQVAAKVRAKWVLGTHLRESCLRRFPRSQVCVIMGMGREVPGSRNPIRATATDRSTAVRISIRSVGETPGRGSPRAGRRRARDVVGAGNGCWAPN